MKPGTEDTLDKLMLQNQVRGFFKVSEVMVQVTLELDCFFGFFSKNLHSLCSCSLFRIVQHFFSSTTDKADYVVFLAKFYISVLEASKDWVHFLGHCFGLFFSRFSSSVTHAL